MWATGDVLIQVPDPVVRWEVKNTRRRLSQGFRCGSVIIYPTHPVRGCVIDTPGASVAGQHPAGNDRVPDDGRPDGTGFGWSSNHNGSLW